MPYVYNILTKHFLGKTTAEEEKLIAEFKKENPVEYKLLAELWQRGDVKIKDFDSHKAWQLVQSKIAAKTVKSAKVIPLYRKLTRIAAAAAILIIGTLSVYYFTDVLPKTTITVVAANSMEKGKEVLLSDGSKVWLNNGALLSFPEKFAENSRTVELKGEAFFKVSRNPEKPFTVMTKNSKTTVLGTSFNINSDKDSTEVIVSTGKVKVSDIENTSGQIITPGYSAKVKKEGVEKYETANLNYMAWKTGKFIFKETPILQVVDDLNKYYKKQIVIADGVDVNCLLTADFNKTNLHEVLEIIKLTCDFSIEEDKDKFIIK